MYIKSILKLYILSILIVPVIVSANISRTCSAHYEITLYIGNTTTLTDKIVITYGSFSAKGGCGKIVPNRCRERARNSAHNCMKEHWDMPAKIGDTMWTPCSNSAIINYRVNKAESLKAQIEQELCNIFSFQTMNVEVNALTKGKKKCSKKVRLGSFTIRCR